MGTRGNIIVMLDPINIVLSTHWGGANLFSYVYDTISKRGLWDDAGGLVSDLHFCMLCGNKPLGSGVRIDVIEDDINVPTIIIIPKEKVVHLYHTVSGSDSTKYTFEDLLMSVIKTDVVWQDNWNKMAH